MQSSVLEALKHVMTSELRQHPQGRRSDKPTNAPSLKAEPNNQQSPSNRKVAENTSHIVTFGAGISGPCGRNTHSSKP